MIKAIGVAIKDSAVEYLAKLRIAVRQSEFWTDVIVCAISVWLANWLMPGPVFSVATIMVLVGLRQIEQTIDRVELPLSPAVYRCTRCGMSDTEARATRCSRGPCPMERSE